MTDTRSELMKTADELQRTATSLRRIANAEALDGEDGPLTENWPDIFDRSTYQRYLGISTASFDRWSGLGQIAPGMNERGAPRWNRDVVFSFHRRTITATQAARVKRRKR